MRVSLRWLRELVPNLEATDPEIAERLTAAGLEVEEVHPFGEGLEGVCVAEVRAITPHPSRDKLRLVTVWRGDREQTVVCGASNVPEPGGLVALGTEGTTLPAAGITLSERKIGGVSSAGMLCSEVELGLAESSDGILVLPEGTAAPGTPLPAAIPSCQDTVLELGVTPNRPDALGHIGVARELAALSGLQFEVPATGAPKRTTNTRVEDKVRIEVQEPDRCPHYGAGFVEDVQVAPSPLWMQWRLHSLGVRPISNVVDITNWLLFEFGQPLHAFDYDLLRGGKVIVRLATAGEPFKTLDGVARTLDPDDLVICDATGPTALAGVMGGENSEIRSSTRRVLLECAYFTPRGVRRASRRHGLQTESSFRFERGVDWAGVPAVLARAQSLLAELAGGAAARDPIHVRGKLPTLPKIRLRSKRLDALLGTPVPFDEAKGIVERLGFPVVGETGEAAERALEVEGASWRPEISREEHLIGEVARVRGYAQIPASLPAIVPQNPRPHGLDRTIRREAANLGLSEAVAFAFVSPKSLELLGAPPATVQLQNPMTEDRSVLRTSLLPGLLDALRHARRHGEGSVRLFTVAARCEGLTSQKTATDVRPRMRADFGVLPLEQPAFAAVLAGSRPAYLQKATEVDVYDAKGLAEELIERLTGQVPVIQLAKTVPKHLHPRGAATIELSGRAVGTLGPLHPDVIEALDLGGGAQVLELDLVPLEAVGRTRPRFRPIPRLPSSGRDVAVVVPDTLMASQIESTIRDAAGDLCESIELFDVFSGDAVGNGRRSLAYHVVYRDPLAATDPDHARTLTDKEVDQCHERVRRALSALGELRG